MNRRGFLRMLGAAPITAPALAVSSMVVQPKLTPAAHLNFELFHYHPSFVLSTEPEQVVGS